MHGDPEYAEGTLFRATEQIDELTGEEELQALIHGGVLVLVKPCEHGDYDKHVLAEFGWFGRSWCQGAGLMKGSGE